MSRRCTRESGTVRISSATAKKSTALRCSQNGDPSAAFHPAHTGQHWVTTQEKGYYMPSAIWEPGDDICPPWWPQWWRKPPWPPPPKGLEKLEQIHLTLTIHELARGLSDAGLAKQIQGLTGAALGKQVEGIGR